MAVVRHRQHQGKHKTFPVLVHLAAYPQFHHKANRGIMKKHILLTATALVAYSSSALGQFSPGATTDYETAKVSIWTEDKANDLVEYADQFACIVKNSRGDLFGNGEWEALIDEGDCFGAETDSRSGPQYARALMSSSRTSENDPQNVVAYFLSNQGNSEQRFVANVTDRQSGPMRLRLVIGHSHTV